MTARQLVPGWPADIGLEVSPLSAAFASNRFPGLLQDGKDVHGSHGLFYWLRTRGRGLLLRRGGAAVVVAWRADARRLVAVRPIGEAASVADLLDSIATLSARAVPGTTLVVRYCLPRLAGVLKDRGWRDLSRPWTPTAPCDDETFPEVIVTANPVDLPAGTRHRALRQAIHLHTAAFRYSAVPRPVGRGELDLADRTAACCRRDHEDTFNGSLAGMLDRSDHHALTYHYLTDRDGGLAAFAITGNLTGVSHGYFLAVRNVPRLAAYFLWKLYVRERLAGAAALNLGGSENASLHRFKSRTFPDHRLQRSTIVEYAGTSAP